METKLLQLAVNNLHDEVEKLRNELKNAIAEIEKLKALPSVTDTSAINVSPDRPDLDELLDIKEAQSLLGICYNSLSKLIKTGQINPIRINQRRVRFTRRSIIQFISSNS